VGYWSILSSVDTLDEHCDYPVAMDADSALRTVETVLSKPGRVICESQPDGSIKVRTVQHTPAWAFIGLVPLLFVRRERVADVTVTSAPIGSVVHARGRLDTKAATRLRDLRAA
jgi:hypothetical protein